MSCVAIFKVFLLGSLESGHGDGGCYHLFGLLLLIPGALLQWFFGIFLCVQEQDGRKEEKPHEDGRLSSVTEDEETKKDAVPSSSPQIGKFGAAKAKGTEIQLCWILQCTGNVSHTHM